MTKIITEIITRKVTEKKRIRNTLEDREIKNRNTLEDRERKNRKEWKFIVLCELFAIVGMVAIDDNIHANRLIEDEKIFFGYGRSEHHTFISKRIQSVGVSADEPTLIWRCSWNHRTS